MTNSKKAKAATNVYDYWKAVMHIEPKHDSGTIGLKDFPMDSHCGIECKKIIDKTIELLEICDTHPHVVDPIKSGALTAVEIICFG